MTRPAREQAEAEVRAALRRISGWASEASPPPVESRPSELVLYGLAQPLWGLRTVLRDRDLFGLALAPVLLVAAVCGATAWAKASDDGPLAVAVAFFAAFAGLAAVPPILFQRTYARLAARVQNELGLGPREPYLRSLPGSLWDSLSQLIVIAIGVAPLAAVLGWVPTFGAFWAASLQALWTLHWIVVEAFDSARTLAPGESVAQAEQAGTARPGIPWFVRPFQRELVFPVNLLVLPAKVCGHIAAALSARWRPEVDRVEAHPLVALGFGLGTALLLAIPGVNLFFRPAIVIGAAHLAARLDSPLPAGLGPTGTRPYPAVGAGAVGPTGTQPYPTIPAEDPGNSVRG